MCNDPRRVLQRGLVFCAIVLAALNLRPALAGVSPLLADITRDLRLTPAAAGLITTVMVVCLGVASPLAPPLVRRWGVNGTLFAALVVLTAGILLRSGGTTVPLYAGAAVAGSAIAMMNVVMPAVVKQDFPDRVGTLTSVYVSGLAAGSTVTAGLMVPIQQASGGSWQIAAGSIAVLSAVAALAWLPRARRSGRTAQQGRGLTTLLRDRVAWSVTAFMGLQSLTFYVVLAWLPSIFRDAGVSAEQAGYLLALSNLSQLVTTLTVPALAARARSQSAFAAIGPVAVGLLRQATGNWTVPLIAILGVLTAQLTAGVLAGRPHLITRS